MNGEQEDAAAHALEDALQDARAVTGWCEAVGQDAVRRGGMGAAAWWTDMAYARAQEVRGQVADAVRKLEFAAGEFQQARNSPPR